MAVLKQSTAYTRMFKLISSTDHLSLKAAASPVVNISKAGAAFAAAGGVVTEVANGWYKIALTTTDTNTLGDLAFYITAAGADDTDFVDQVTANILGDTLPANVTQLLGTAWLTPAVAGTPDVNAKQLGGTAQTGRDIGASVLLSAGVGTGQLDFTSGVVKSNMVQVLGGACPAVTVTGVPKVDVADWLGSAPNALVSGRVDASAGALAASVITAASIAAAALNGKGDWLLASSYTAPPTTAAIATAIWTDLLAGADFATVSSVGKLLKDDIDATISSRSTYAGADTAGTTTLLTRIASALTITGGKVDVNDKTGFSLAATGLDQVLIDGKTLPVATAIIAAGVLGKVSGAGSGTEVFKGLDGATGRATVTVDASGNRTAVTYP